jgi:hypothetical protein
MVAFQVVVTDMCAAASLITTSIPLQTYAVGQGVKSIYFTPWTTSAGNCGLYSYVITNGAGGVIPSFVTWNPATTTLIVLTTTFPDQGNYNIQIDGTLSNGRSGTVSF